MYSFEEDSKHSSDENYISQSQEMGFFIQGIQSKYKFDTINQDKNEKIANGCQISILQQNFENSLANQQTSKSNQQNTTSNKAIDQQSLSLLLKQYEQRIKTQIDSQNYRNDKLIKKLKSTIQTNQAKIQEKTNKIIEIEEKFKRHQKNYKKELLKLQNSLQQFKKYFQSTYEYTIKRMLDVEEKVSILSDLSQCSTKQSFLEKTKQIAYNVLSIVNSCVLESAKNRQITLQKIDEVISKSQLLEQQINQMKIQTFVFKNYSIKKQCIEQDLDRLKDTVKMWESAYVENNNDSLILGQQIYHEMPNNKITDLQKKIDNLKKQLKDHEQISDQYCRKIQSLTQTIKEKEIKIANLDEIVDNLRCQLLETKQQTQRYIGENDDTTDDKMQKLELQFKNYEYSMNQELRVLKQIIKKKEAEIRILKGNNQCQYPHYQYLSIQPDEDYKKILKKKSELSFGIRESFDNSLQFSISPANSVSKLSQKVNKHSNFSNKNQDDKKTQKQLEQLKNYNEQLLKENKILISAVNQLESSYEDCLGFLELHERKSRQMEAVIKQLHIKTEQYQKSNILLQGQNEHLKEQLMKQKNWRIQKKLAEQDIKLLTKLTALSKKYDKEQQNYPLTHRQPLKNFNEIQQNFQSKHGQTQRLPSYRKDSYNLRNDISYTAKSKQKDKSKNKKLNYQLEQDHENQIKKYQKYSIFTQSNSQYEYTERSKSSKNSSRLKNIKTNPRVQKGNVEVQKKYATSRVDNAVIWSLKRSLQRMDVKMPAICQIDRTGYLKSIQSRTYIINQKGGLFNLNSAELDLAQRKRIITLIH